MGTDTKQRETEQGITKKAAQRQIVRFSEVKPTELELTNELFKYSGDIGDSSTYGYVVTVKNNSTHPIAYMYFRFRLLDCTLATSKCDTVGDEGISIGSNYDYMTNPVLIPIGQKREFSESVSFKNLPKINEGQSREYSRELQSVATP